MSNQPNPEQQPVRTPEERRAARAKQKQRFLKKRQWNNMRFNIFGILLLLVYFVIALVFLTFFPRSKVSNIENRNLTSFPEFTLSS